MRPLGLLITIPLNSGSDSSQRMSLCLLNTVPSPFLKRQLSLLFFSPPFLKAQQCTANFMPFNWGTHRLLQLEQELTNYMQRAKQRLAFQTSHLGNLALKLKQIRGRKTAWVNCDTVFSPHLFFTPIFTQVQVQGG